MVNNIKKNDIEIKIYNFTASSYKEVFSIDKIMFYIIGMIIIILLGKIINLPDWDIYLSIIMPTSTFLISGITTGKLINSYINKNKYFLIWLILWIICFEWNVDIIYVLYNEYVEHMYFRLPNFIGSSILYILCCGIFSYRKIKK